MVWTKWRGIVLSSGLVLLALAAQGSPATQAKLTEAKPPPGTPAAIPALGKAGGAATCSGGWAIVSSPSPANYDYLYGTAAISENDVWAVGETLDSVGHTLIEHWDGSNWSVVPSPSIGTHEQALYGVAAVSATDVWAVGYYYTVSNGNPQTLVEHWNGTAWSVVASPSPTNNSQLWSVSVISANDIWAAGYATPDLGVQHPLVEHWDGTSWQVVPSPTISGMFHNIDMINNHDGWAVGEYFMEFGAIGIIEHWDGTTWQQVTTPNIANRAVRLYGVSGAASNDVWIVGESYTPATPIPGDAPLLDDQPLILHWNGTALSVVSSSNLGAGGLEGITAISAADVWAVGNSNWTTLTAHWNGSTWQGVASPNANVANELASVAALSSGTIWAVGNAGVNGNQFARHTLTERYTPPGLCPTSTPSATVTLTATATATRTPIACVTETATTTATAGTETSTPTVSPTACSIQFSDVADTSAYYYAPVYYLACRGVVSGYADGTFKPGNNTTRGQIAKIVTEAFALPHQTPAAGGYTFTDVPPTDTFFPYVETAAANGLVTGYTCGHTNPQTGQSETCDSAGRPYYRPGNFVSRGQLSKIVVVAAIQAEGWDLRTPPNPTFDDVPPSSTFYSYIETAAYHGIVGGYNDYTFRPSNLATRGQIAKIVYLALTSTALCGSP